MPPLPAQGNAARHGLLVVAIVAALGLLFSGWSSRRGAEALADTVNQGQAESLLRALRERFPPHRGEPPRELLSAFVDEHRFEGLRGIGIVGAGGEVQVLAGTMSDVPAAKDLGPGPHVRSMGEILRVYSAPPGELSPRARPPLGGRREGPPADGPRSNGPPEGPPNGLGEPHNAFGEPHNPFGGPASNGPPEGPPNGFDRPPNGFGEPPNGFGGPPPEGPPPRSEGRTVLELSPRLSQNLMSRANRAFAIAAVAAAILLAAATLLWRRAVREAALARKLADNERLVSLGTMSAVLAHEIKNPLASLKGNAQLVAEALDEGSRPRAQADRVVEAAVRLQTLVANLLDFARGGPIERTLVDPAELVFLAACEASPKAKLALDGAPATFSLDAVRIGQVLENVLRNAEQASPDRVSASVTLEGDRLVIVVTDEGPGFSGAPEGFFEPFATTKARGMGLGLAVARRIVELHGGTITARNRTEGGAEVRIEIPPP